MKLLTLLNRHLLVNNLNKLHNLISFSVLSFSIIEVLHCVHVQYVVYSTVDKLKEKILEINNFLTRTLIN